ncbi:MAG: hypothetical protein COB22_05865 [Cycloclasticus sp.]|nr:MAG: hypothetical protein COB22_05865 [Cycloclasticus sp.]
MDNGLKTVVDFMGLNGVLAAAGGFIKIMFNIGKAGFTWFTSFKILFIATLIGALVGGAIAELWGVGGNGSGLISALAGIGAYNFAEAVEQASFKSVVAGILSRGKR